jgi:hypothetical protein
VWKRCQFGGRHNTLYVLDLQGFFLSQHCQFARSAEIQHKRARARLTSPPAASDKLPPSSTPRMRKSKGTTRGNARAVLMSCES